MLVLTRKREQKITIGKNIVITILKIQGDKVSIGIEADRDTPVYRSELLTKENPRKKEEVSHLFNELGVEIEKEQSFAASSYNDN